MKKSVAEYIKGRIKAFSYAFNGLRILFKGERNAQIQLVLAIIALLLGVFLRISALEWVVVCMLIGLVFANAIDHRSDASDAFLPSCDRRRATHCFTGCSSLSS